MPNTSPTKPNKQKRFSDSTGPLLSRQQSFDAVPPPILEYARNSDFIKYLYLLLNLTSTKNSKSSGIAGNLAIFREVIDVNSHFVNLTI